MRALVTDLIERAEDVIYLVVAALLVLAALVLVVSVGVDAYNDFQKTAPDLVVVVVAVLDKGLVLFMVAELLHTVRITVRERGLAAEPFLIVGLIAAIRRVLVVTAQSEHNFQWNPDGVQLTILGGLVIVMAGAIFVWRRSIGVSARKGG